MAALAGSMRPHWPTGVATSGYNPAHVDTHGVQLADEHGLAALFPDDAGWPVALDVRYEDFTSVEYMNDYEKTATDGQKMPA